jgi:hypothetical protein
MGDSPLGNITKIGNFALPAFGAFLTASFSIGKLDWGNGRERYLIVSFALYTVLSAFVSYFHRNTWLRHQNEKNLKDKDNNNNYLSTSMVHSFMSVHLLLIICLFIVIYNFVWK